MIVVVFVVETAREDGVPIVHHVKISVVPNLRVISMTMELLANAVIPIQTIDEMHRAVEIFMIVEEALIEKIEDSDEILEPPEIVEMIADATMGDTIGEGLAGVIEM